MDTEYISGKACGGVDAVSCEDGAAIACTGQVHRCNMHQPILRLVPGHGTVADNSLQAEQ